jgi:hypothetical protein
LGQHKTEKVGHASRAERRNMQNKCAAKQYKEYSKVEKSQSQEIIKHQANNFNGTDIKAI